MDKQEKIPNREWLLGWFDGAYMSSFTTEGYLRHMKNIKRRSRESLWNLYKKITNSSRGAKL